MTAVQPGQPFRDKPLTPVRHKAAAAPHSLTHGIPGRSFTQEQNHAGPPRGFGTPGPAPGSSDELHPFTFRQDNRVFHEHDYSLEIDVTVH